MASIEVLEDIIMSGTLIAAAGLRGKNFGKNRRVEMEDGRQNINIAWANSLREFDLGFIPMLLDDWKQIKAIHEITYQGAYGFLIKDPQGSFVDSGVATLISAGVYQLHERFTDTGSSLYRDRKVTRPIPADFLPLVSGVPPTYSLDEETGILSIAANPSASTITWTGSVYTPVHFMDDELEWEIVKPGPESSRLVRSPSCALQEVRE